MCWLQTNTGINTETFLLVIQYMPKIMLTRWDFAVFCWFYLYLGLLLWHQGNIQTYFSDISGTRAVFKLTFPISLPQGSIQTYFPDISGTWAIYSNLFLAATKQLYEWFSPSVRLSVRLSVCPSVRLSVTPFWLCSHHPIIMKFSGVITSDKSDVHAKGQGQRSKVKVTEVTTQIFVSGL